MHFCFRSHQNAFQSKDRFQCVGHNQLNQHGRRYSSCQPATVVSTTVRRNDLATVQSQLLTFANFRCSCCLGTFRSLQTLPQSVQNCWCEALEHRRPHLLVQYSRDQLKDHLRWHPKLPDDAKSSHTEALSNSPDSLARLSLSADSIFRATHVSSPRAAPQDATYRGSPRSQRGSLRQTRGAAVSQSSLSSSLVRISPLPREANSAAMRVCLHSGLCFVSTVFNDKGEVAPLAPQASPVLARPTW